MMALLTNRRDSATAGKVRQINDYKDGVETMATSFNQTNTEEDSNGSIQMKRVLCFTCGEQGHIARNYPKYKQKDVDRRQESDKQSKKKMVNAFMRGGDDDGEVSGWFSATSFD
jgi:6-phosphogluconolactonase/glucosamine-6-phosphate isomerase/deaminase